MSLRVVFAGTPAFAATALEAVAAHYPIVGVLTQPDRPAGRGRAVQGSPVKAAALARGLPVAQPPTLRGGSPEAGAALAQLADWRPDVMVVVAYGLILPRAVLALPRLGCLNIHASLLPRWRGAAPIQRAILAGDAQSGVTIMQMDEGLDTGPMLLARSLPIGAAMVAGELHDALAALGATLIVEALAGVEAGTLAAVAQPPAGVSYAAKLTKAEGIIDWQAGVTQIDRQIRAFNPWPAAQAVFRGEPVKLLRSRVLAGRTAPTGAAPGTVLGLRDGLLEVACSDGVLGLAQLQRAGRRAVSVQDFANADLRDGAAAVFT
jgi:methionyl-tRNA formyltransferase